jgi:hypothetical protein
LIRRDQSSLFGADQRSAELSGVGCARLTEHPDPGHRRAQVPRVVGTAGLRPIFNAQYEVLSMS